MIALICFVLVVLASPFKSNIRLEAENAVLRHQLIVLRRKLKGRARSTNHDRWFLVQLYRWFPSILPVLVIIRPETLLRWHQAGFRRYWRWKSCRRGGRPQIETELRALIRQMSTENLLWGAPRIHGELLKLGSPRIRVRACTPPLKKARFAQSAEGTARLEVRPKSFHSPAAPRLLLHRNRVLPAQARCARRASAVG